MTVHFDVWLHLCSTLAPVLGSLLGSLLPLVFPMPRLRDHLRQTNKCRRKERSRNMTRIKFKKTIARPGRRRRLVKPSKSDREWQISGPRHSYLLDQVSCSTSSFRYLV